MKKIILVTFICMMALGLFACKGKDEKIEYNDKEGEASGSVVLEGDDPDIKITNIKAKVGTDIDYLSRVIVEDEDKFDDLEVWVDASAVDIYEPGDYKAKYTFKYNGKSVEHFITVTIVEGEVEESAGESNNAQGNTTQNDNAQGDDGVANDNAGNNQESQTTQNVADNDATNENAGTTKPPSTTKPVTTTKQNNTTSKQNVTTTKQNATTKPVTTTKPTATTTKQNATTKPATTTKPVATTSGSSSETTRRQMITSAGNTTTKTEDIGYAYIDLLSGSTVSIKSTTERYILLTRTDVSYITKNGVDYKVSKLVIRYNTGEERTLETVEEKCN